jgi:uncharacterized protein YdaU (DUF1376 family)
MHFYQFHIGDYKSHTHHLTLLEDLAFRRLLDYYYLHETAIKQREIARKIGMVEHEQEVLTVLEEFFLSTDEGYINPRADVEILKYRKLSEDGKKGAAKRWLKGSDSPPIAPPIATKNQEPITNNQEPSISMSEPTVLTCPQKEILILWKKHLPALSQPRSWEGARQAALKQRWIQASKPSSYSEGYKTEAEGLVWWDAFFAYLAKDTSLASGYESAGRVWRPDLEWVINATNFQKIIDGKYDK